MSRIRNGNKEIVGKEVRVSSELLTNTGKHAKSRKLISEYENGWCGIDHTSPETLPLCQMVHNWPIKAMKIAALDQNLRNRQLQVVISAFFSGSRYINLNLTTKVSFALNLFFENRFFPEFNFLFRRDLKQTQEFTFCNIETTFTKTVQFITSAGFITNLFWKQKS